MSMLSRIKYAAYLLPLAALAQTDAELEEQYGTFAAFARLLISVHRLVNLLIPVVLGIALLSFFWGLARFIANAGDETAQVKGRRLMVGGIIAFVVMSSIWGIVAFIQASLGLTGGGQAAIPVSGIPVNPQ